MKNLSNKYKTFFYRDPENCRAATLLVPCNSSTDRFHRGQNRELGNSN